MKKKSNQSENKTQYFTWITPPQKQPETQESMFTRLYKYIIGVNSGATEIDMSRPVVTKRVPLVRNRERLEMCFWTGSEWKNKVLPDPLKNDVYIMEIPAIQVYVR